MEEWKDDDDDDERCLKCVHKNIRPNNIGIGYQNTLYTVELH